MENGIPEILIKNVPGIISNWEKFRHYFKEEHVPAKKIILAEDDIAKRIFYIQSGCLRMYFTDLEKDVTVQFFFEGTHVCSMESFLKHIPSKFSLETLEECTFFSLSHENFIRLTAELPEFREYFHSFIESRMFHYVNLLLDYIRLSPEQRYKALLESNPEIPQRVSQYHIASYLGITPVSYSRIRNRR
jgi:CRP-like cAMP-binding protein